LLNCEYVDERQCNAIHDSAPKLQIAIGRNDRPGDMRHPASLGAATSTRHDAADWNNPRKNRRQLDDHTGTQRRAPQAPPPVIDPALRLR